MRLQDELPGTGESDEELSYGPYDWEIETDISNTEDPAIRRVEMTVYRINERVANRRQQQLVFTGFLGQN